MGLALVFSDADFSTSSLKTISLDNLNWSNVNVLSYNIVNTGFVYGKGNRAGEANPSAGAFENMWKYTEFINIPNGSKKIKGTSNTSRLLFGERYIYYPAIVFYDENDSYVGGVYEEDFFNVIAEGVQTTGNSGDGVVGDFIIEIPESAKKYRIQWLYSTQGSGTTISGFAPIVIDTPIIMIGS